MSTTPQPATTGIGAMPSLAEISSAAGAPTLESMARPLLDWLQRMTGLESTYLTSIDWDADEQEVLYAVNRGRIDIEEGISVPWSETLCKRALEGGTPVTDDVPGAYGDHAGARALGLQTYVSVPLSVPGGTIVGTLCGVSSERSIPDEQVLTVMRFFAQLIADRVGRDRELARERAHVAELEQANDRVTALEKTKGEFLRVASHELRQPCTVALGYIDMMLEGMFGELSPALRESLELVSRRVSDMNRMLDAMTDTARLEDDRLDLHVTPADLRAVVTRACDGLRPGIGDRHQLVLDLPPEPVPVQVDEDRVGIVISNLLNNAVKYSPQGGAVRCTVWREGSCAYVAVDDEGVGITREQVVTLFGRFSRIEDEAHAGIPGTGLGLHISRELARRHGGDLTFMPRAPRGTRFMLSLPVRTS